MAIEKVIEIKIDADDAVKSLNQVNDELLEQKKITIELERELEKLEQQLKDTPKNSLAEQKKLREQIDHVKNSLKDQRTSVKELGVQKQELTNTVKKLNSEQKELGGNLSDNQGLMTALDGVTGGTASTFLSLKDSIMAGTKASLAFIATPLGVFLASIVSVALLVKNAFDRNEESATKLTGVFNVFSAMVSKLLNALVPLGKFVIDVMVKGFEILGNTVNKTFSIISAGLNALGFEDASKSITQFSEDLDKTAKSAMNLAKMEKELEKQMRVMNRLQLEYQKDAEKLRQLRDDESRSIEDRIKSNEQLGALLKRQANDELRIANLALKVAQEKLKNDRTNKELLDKEEEAKLKIAEINERITSQESEQLVNLNSLKKERKQAQEEITKKYREEAEKRAEIARAEVEKLRAIYQDYEKKIQDLQAKTDKEKQDLEEKRQLVAIDQIETTEEKKEIARQKVREFFALKDQERADAELVLEREKQEKVQAILDEFAMKRADALDKTEEEKLALDLQKLDIEKEKQLKQLDDLKATEAQKLELIAFYRSQEQKINDDFVKAEMARQKLVNKQKLDLTKSTFGAIATILGENSKAGKVFASGQALINTYQGVTEILANKTTLPEPFGTINKVASAGAVIASGLRAVQQINSVQTLGGGGGATPSGGGSPTVTPPSFNIVAGTGTNQIAEAVGNANQKPVKAYVVSSDIKTNESLERNIQKSSEF